MMNIRRDLAFPVLAHHALYIAFGSAAVLFAKEAPAMQNPFLNDLRSVSVACEGAGEADWCEVAASVIRTSVDVPVSIVDASALPLNPGGDLAMNDAWLSIRLGSIGAEFRVNLEWGSAMRMAGVPNGRAEARVPTGSGLQDKTMWHEVLAASPFVHTNQ